MEKRLLKLKVPEVKAEQGKDGDAAKKDEKQKDAGGDKKPQAEKTS